MAYNDNRGPRHNDGHRGHDRGGYQSQQVQIPNITLDYTKDVELFGETAQKVAQAISGTKSTQIRNFYEYVLDLEQRSKTQPFGEILPFVKMLNSKAHYAKERRVASVEFIEMLKKCIEQVKSPKDLETFKLFFEAVIGFSKK